jgi:DNA segregation ATPase FtsK/SpoIIIE, S-DNA-T family
MSGKKKKQNINKDETVEFLKEKEEQVNLEGFTKDERFQKLIGLLCLVISLFLFISFASYLFTWRNDQSEVMQHGFKYLFLENTKIAANILGRFGAVISHFLMYNTFGIASFLFVSFFFILGINLLFEHRFFSLKKNIKIIIIGCVSISILLAYLFQSNPQFWGGAFGHNISSWLINFIGYVGAGLLLLVCGISFFIWKFNPNLKYTSKTATTLKSTDNNIKSNVSTFENNLDYEAQQMKDSESNSTQVQVANEFASKSNQLKHENGVVVLAPQSNQDFEQQLELIVKNNDDLQQEEVSAITMISDDVITEDDIENTNVNAPTAFSIEPITKKEKFIAEENVALEINTAAIETNIEAEAEIDAQQHIGALDTIYDPLLDLSEYKYPIIDLLEIHGSERIVQDPGELEANKNQIIATLRNYDIEIQKIMATVGPTVTLYEIVPAPGVRISRIKNLEDDIALSLAALGIRIIAPIPGKGTIGIEVPNLKKTIVSMRTLLSSEKFQKNNFSLPIALGKKIDNENFIVDLATMPHLLMAGATGQGKSVGLNAVLVSLLYKKHPSQLKFVLVDPKKVELSLYKHIEKHFLAKLPGEDESIITDTKKVVHTLNALCIEMDNRYDLLKEAGCRNIKEYNEKFVSRKLNPEKGHQYLPFIVLVIDEFADLIMTAGKEVETPIARLAQLARAIGIHLIIATQRPSVNIITGTIKANFPARIAFKVSSKIDSRTILDTGGAEQLIGKGDMLISYNGELTRLQCAFVDTPEVDKVVAFIGEQRGYPDAFMLPEYVDENDASSKNFDVSEKDSLFEEAAKLIVMSQSGSTSLIQRKLKLGYNRAGRVMDQLEAAGIVGPAQGSKPRDVYVKTDADLFEILNSFG